MDFWKFQSIIYLNNTAVALLQRQCYRQAVETWHDAITILKSTPTVQHAHELDIQSMLQKAAKNLSKPKSSKPTCSDATFEIISDNDISTTLQLQKSIDAHDASCRHYLILIECIDIESDNSDDELTLETAVILYNYSVAFQFMSVKYNGTLTPKAAENLRHKGMKMLQHVHGILVATCFSTPLQTSRSILVAWVVLCNLVRDSHGIETHQSEYFSMLMQLAETINRFPHLYCCTSTSAGAA